MSSELQRLEELLQADKNPRPYEPRVKKELIELVQKQTRTDGSLGYVSRRLIAAIDELDKAERAYSNAESIYRSRLFDVLVVLEGSR